MTEVHLAIYDLSHGMARNLSAQFLGPNHVIDMIPHTGLLVFGKEYFFGGDIQAMNPSEFRRFSGMAPVLTQRLGITTVTHADFERWCQTVGNVRFNVQTYDLLSCNCNHFCHEAAIQGLQLPIGIPDWILQVPQRFLSSPMGQIIRPMLEQMQVTKTAPVQAQAPLQLQPQPQPPPQLINVNQNNPWATMPSSSSTTTSTTSTNSQNRNARFQPTPPSKTTATTTLTTNTTKDENYNSTNSGKSNYSVLDKFTKPMISKDTQSIAMCVKKLSPCFSNDTSRQAFMDLSQTLQLKLTSSTTAEPNHNQNVDDDDDTTIITHKVEWVLEEFWNWMILPNKTSSSASSSIATTNTTTVTTFSLLFLRLIALEFLPIFQQSACWNDMIPIFGQVGGWKTPTTRSLAWCVLSNALAAAASLSTSTTTTTNTNTLTNTFPSHVLLEAAIRDWNHDTVQVRQAACTFLYNFVLLSSSHPSSSSLSSSSDHGCGLDEETTVSLICSSLESLSEETDATTRLRRLLVGARVVFCVDNGCNEMAKDLVQDLGFVGLLKELAHGDDDMMDATNEHADAKDCRRLALELIQKLNN